MVLVLYWSVCFYVALLHPPLKWGPRSVQFSADGFVCLGTSNRIELSICFKGNSMR